MSATLEDAKRVIDATLQKAKEMNIKVSAAVVDAGGRLVAFHRMDGAFFGSVYGSQGKAQASAAFAKPSAAVQDRADTPIIRGIVQAEGGHMIPSQGAVPLLRDGVLMGAVGVSGALPAQDEECAIAGAAKF